MSLLITRDYANKDKPLWVPSSGGTITGNIVINGQLDVTGAMGSETSVYAPVFILQDFSGNITGEISHQALAEGDAGDGMVLSGDLITFAKVGTNQGNTTFTPSVYGANLDNFTVCVKQLAGGIAQDPFIGFTHIFAPPDRIGERMVRYLDPADIVRQSRRNYAERRDVVAAKIERWMDKELPETGDGGKSRTQLLDAEIRRRAAARSRKGRQPETGAAGFKSIGELLKRPERRAD